MDKVDIRNLSKAELEEALARLGAERYRAAQMVKRLYRRLARSFEEMSDLPEELRAKLKANFRMAHLALLDSKRSPLDGTTKYLFKLEDSNTIEAVFLPEARRNTICLSSQVGCRFSCSFCASAPFGFVRNLDSAEILEEVIELKSRNRDAQITNIVFMGIGEPLDNYDNVMKAVRILNAKDAFNIGARKITISTCGIIPGIERLKSEGLQIELSVSLHSADDKIRSRLIPVNKKYPLKDLIGACREYTDATKRVITFEYVLIKGVNSSREDALDLAHLLKEMKCKVNAILYNQIRAKDFSAPSAKEAEQFVRALKDSGVKATFRKSKGEDIDAGCGQLRISRL
jgi:23S rRNA (adenine2503-C2)-methyltransferase